MVIDILLSYLGHSDYWYAYYGRELSEYVNTATSKIGAMR